MRHKGAARFALGREARGELGERTTVRRARSCFSALRRRRCAGSEGS
jgi:hypothetical protein